ncbi:hypothetical protein [uncultured Methanobrevibacter sp.]|uniref:hypothetical protein n=1 Tax=uncultured Methanobrevibacter sp. TaxID=253161 RepID=UPI0025FAF7C1|nr:hypothetical protein [uncultured Methanobrevibacter sp.]
MAEKNMWIAMIISFIFAGLGIAYADNLNKGFGLFISALICGILGVTVNIVFIGVAIIIWIYSLYATYKEVEYANGEL